MLETLIPVLQTLFANSLWAAGCALVRAAEHDDDLTRRLRIFTGFTLDSEAILASVPYPEDVQPDVFDTVLHEPELLHIAHQFLTSSILEQPLDLASVRTAIKIVAQQGTTKPSDIEVDAIADTICGWFSTACEDLLEHLDQSDLELRQSIQMLAGLSSIETNVRTIAESLKSLLARPVENRHHNGEFTASYRTYITRVHGTLTVPDLDVERQVPVDQLYVPPTLSRASDRRESSAGMRLTDPLDILDHWPRAVVLGHPGAGKSTLASVLAYRLARGTGLTPLLVTLRKYGRDYEDGLSIVQHLEKTLTTEFQLTPPSEWVTDILWSTQAVVIFDGLDELLEPSKRREIRNAVESFGEAFPFVRILVTSRAVGYPQSPLAPDFVGLVLGPFNLDGVELYVRNWFTHAQYGLSPEERERRIASFLIESESVADLRTNPLLLSLMCVLYRGTNYIPESRLSLYEECAKLLFRRWDRSRGIQVPLELGQADIDAALMSLAKWMIDERQADEGISETSLIEHCAQHLMTRRYEDLDEARRVSTEFVDFCRNRAWVLSDAGLSAAGERLYTFTHRTFLEYYAAVQIARVCESPEGIADQVLSQIVADQLEVVAQLALQMANKMYDLGADRFLHRLLRLCEAATPDDGDARTILQFIARSLQYVAPTPELVRLLVRHCYELEVIRGDHPRDTEVPIGSLSPLLGASSPSLRIVADEVRVLLIRDMGTPTESAVRNRQLAVAILARVVCRVLREG